MDLTRIGWTEALYSPDIGGMETRQADGSGETTPDSWPSAAVEPSGHGAGEPWTP